MAVTVTIGNIRVVMNWEEFSRFVEMEKARAEQMKQPQKKAGV